MAALKYKQYNMQKQNAPRKCNATNRTKEGTTKQTTQKEGCTTFGYVLRSESTKVVVGEIRSARHLFPTGVWEAIKKQSWLIATDRAKAYIIQIRISVWS